MVITNARISSAFLHFVPLFESYFFVLHFKIIWTHIPYIINSSICLRVKYTVFAQNISNWDWAQAGLSIFIKCTSTSLFTDGTFYENLNISHEYLIQHSLKLGGTNCLVLPLIKWPAQDDNNYLKPHL